MTRLALAILRRSWVFQAAPVVELEWLAARSAVQRFRRTERITRRGATADGLFVVSGGRVKGTLPSPDDEGELVVSMFWPGDVFGEVAILDGSPFLGSALAITEVEVLAVPRTEVLALLQRRPAVALRLMGAICEKLRTALELSLSLRFLDVASRFACRLQYLARYDSHLEDGGLRIRHGLSQLELADSIGTTRESLNKLIGEWKRDGLVEWGRGYVLVRDPARLAERISPSLRRDGFLDVASQSGSAVASA